MVGKAKRRMFLPVTGRWYESSLVSMIFSFRAAGGKGFLFYKTGLYLFRAGVIIGAISRDLMNSRRQSIADGNKYHRFTNDYSYW